MTLSMHEKSDYFRGLLVLIKMDRKIDAAETEMMIKVGKTLGFEKKFCLNAIKELLDNEFISEEIPIFTCVEHAKSFILDGLRLAISDNDLNPHELDFLRRTLDLNGLDEAWFNEKIKLLAASNDYNNSTTELFIEKHLEIRIPDAAE